MSEGDRQVKHQVILTSWLIKVAEGSTVCILGFIINRSLELRTEVSNTGCFLIFLVLEPPEEIKNMFLPPRFWVNYLGEAQAQSFSKVSQLNSHWFNNGQS